MKTMHKNVFVIAFVILLAACQSNGDVNQVLSKPDTRKAMKILLPMIAA